MPDYYIVSQRLSRCTPAQGCLVEFENVIAHCCGGKILTPIAQAQSWHSKLRQRGKGTSYLLEVPPRPSQEPQVLMIVDLDINSLPDILESIPQWRSRFDIVCAYIFDAFIPKTEYAKSAWKRQLSRYSRLISSLDYLFIPMTGSLSDFRELYNIRVEFVPIACDVQQFAPQLGDRFIDLIGYGRQNPEHSRLFAHVYNQIQSPRLYYHTDHMHIGKIHDFTAHRRLFWKILARSRVALAYDALKVDPQKRFPFSFVGQRWFESITAGCLIVGQKPTCPEMQDLFFWEDATLDLPEQTSEVLPFIEALLEDKQRLEAASRRNIHHAKLHHDWRHRLVQIHEFCNLPLPPQLKEELALLSRSLGEQPS